MTIDDVRKVAEKNGVHVVVYEYTGFRVLFKITGHEQSIKRFVEEVRDNLSIFIAPYFVYSRREWVTRLKLFVTKLKQRLRKRDLIMTSTLELPPRPGVYIRYLH